MNLNRKTVLYFVLAFCLVSTNTCASGLGELRNIARAQADAQKAYREETKNYQSVVKAIKSGAIKKGQSEKSILDRYGEPVVSVNESGTGRNKFIYKPANATFFDGPRVILFFDRDANLDETKITE